MASEDSIATPSVVTLTTDFGLQDGYVAAMKAVILSRAPNVRLIDITHKIAPQSVLEAGFVVETACRMFPPGSVHVVVVDPGVGTSRRRLALASGGHYFVGPDNGCLSPALPNAVRGLRSSEEAYSAREVSLTEGMTAVAIENEALLRNDVSATFEGRDVFAPVAAYLAGGGAIEGVGQPIGSVIAFPTFRAPPAANGFDGRVLHVDHFGNLITDILAGDLQSGATFTAAGRRLSLSHTYGDSPSLSAIIGSSGHVELAMPRGSAARALGLGPGARVKVSWSEATNAGGQPGEPHAR